MVLESASTPRRRHASRHALLQLGVPLLRHAVAHELDRHEAPDARTSPIARGARPARPAPRGATAPARARVRASARARRASSVASAAAQAAGSHDQVEPVETSSKPHRALGAEHRADRHHAAAHRLAEAHQVGLDAPALHREHACRCGRTRSSPRRRTAASRARRTARVSAVQKRPAGAQQPPEPSTGSITTPATSRRSTAWNRTWSRR